MATNEGIVLDGLDLNDFTTWYVDSIDMPTPAKRTEWVQASDADGALLVRDPLVDNRTITLRLVLLPQSTMNAALLAIENLSRKLEECEQHLDGLELVWTPAQSTSIPLSFYVLSGTVTSIPITVQGDDAGWFQKTPVVNVTLTCKPFGYEPEVLFGTSTSSSLPLLTLAITGVPGDVPAEARLIVTDYVPTASRAHVEWGLEQRYYNAGSPTDLIVDSDSMTVTGFAGTQTTRTGAYDPNGAGSNVIRSTLIVNPVAACSTGNLAHVGTFRVKLRCYCTSTSVYARLAWKDGDSPYTHNTYARAVVVGWNDLDLGVINVPSATLGTQRWVGLVEAYSTATGDTIDVDMLEMLPAGEGYGKARAIIDTVTVNQFAAFDDFDQTAGVLTGKTLPLGGTWQGAGDADDFSTNGAGGITRVAVNDTATSIANGRLVTASTPTTLTNTTVLTFFQGPSNTVGAIVEMGVLARYTNASNFVACYVDYAFGGPYPQMTIKVMKRVAGVDTLLAVGPTVLQPDWPSFVPMRLTILANGTFVASVSPVGGVSSVSASDTALATGGALAAGTVGLVDRNTHATVWTRTFGTIAAYVPVIDNVIWAGQAAEFRHDGVLRQDATGTYYGPVQTYRGGRFLLPAAGDQNRTTRVAVKARRNDVDIQPDDSITDPTKIEVRYRARHLNVRGS